MDNENELVQVTIRLPLKTKREFDNLAQSNGCSTAEIIRRSVDGSLDRYLDGVQYVDKEQGETIKALLGNVYTELSGMRTELHRIGVNYNQEVKLKNLQNKFSQGQISISELLREQDNARAECQGFSLEAISEQMDRLDAITEEFANVMAYTRISHTRNGRAAIQYARGDGKGHNGHAKRNLLIGCVGMLPDEVIPFEEQMAEDWARASGKNKNQVRRFVASFSAKELDPQSEDSAYAALEMAQEFVEEAYPNRKAAIFVQNDGKGGKLHVHVLISNVDSLENKGCTDTQTRFEYVKQNFNRVASRHIKLDFGEKSKQKLSQNERRLHNENEEAAENGGAAVYCWKDDLRERIRIAMENADSENDFLEALEDEGVTARYGSSKRYGEYISYELVDLPDDMEATGRKYKARSYNLGEAYGVNALREKLREKYKDFFQLSGQRNSAAENKANLPDISQSGLNTGAALAPVNDTLKMSSSTAREPTDIQSVSERIKAMMNTRREAETPIPAQPVKAATAPSSAAEGTDSTPAQEQPVQSATAPQTGKSSALERMRRMARETDEREARKKLENQPDDLELLPRR